MADYIDKHELKEAVWDARLDNAREIFRLIDGMPTISDAIPREKYDEAINQIPRLCRSCKHRAKDTCPGYTPSIPTGVCRAWEYE